MSETSDPPSWWLWFSPFFAFLIELCKESFKRMKTWPRSKLKDFWGHVGIVMFGLFIVGFVLHVYNQIPVDLVAVFLGLFSNFEQAYVPALLNSVVLGLGVIGSWLIYSDSKCCIRVVRYGEC